MIVEVYIDALSRAFFCDSIEDFQSCCAFIPAWVHLDNIIEDGGAIVLTKGIDECCLDRDVIAIVIVDLIDHLRRKCKPDGIESRALDLGDDVLNGFVLKALRNHHLTSSRPVGSIVCEHRACRILDPLFLHSKRRVREGERYLNEQDQRDVKEMIAEHCEEVNEHNLALRTILSRHRVLRTYEKSTC